MEMSGTSGDLSTCTTCRSIADEHEQGVTITMDALAQNIPCMHITSRSRWNQDSCTAQLHMHTTVWLMWTHTVMA